MIYLALICIFLFLLSFIFWILFVLFYKEKPIDKLRYYEEDYVIKERIENSKKKKVSFLKLLSKLVPSSKDKKKSISKIEMQLIKADVPLTVEELLVIKILSSTVLAFLGFSLSKDIIIGLLLFIVIWNIPRFIIVKKRNKRLHLFNQQINEGIIIISNSLKAGYSFLQAVAVVVEETHDPFSKEFKRLLKEMSLGISTEDALKGMLNRIDSEDLRLIINAILIQKDIGGNLSEILENISDTIRDRQKIQSELKTLTAQGKMSGFIVALMPIVLGLTLYLFNKEYILVLFNTVIGLAMISSAVISQVFGLIIIKKIIKIQM